MTKKIKLPPLAVADLKRAEKEVKLLRAELNLRKGSWGEVSRNTGLGYRWIVSLARGEINDPGYTLYERLRLYCARTPRPQIQA